MAEISYRLERAREGSGIIVILRDGKEFPLHSRIDPVREGIKGSPELDPGRHDLLIALGCGMGYHLSGLASAAGSYRRIIVIDILPGLEGILPAESAVLLSRDNAVFLSGMDPKDIEARLSELIDLDLCRGVQVVEHPQSFRLFPEYYDAVKKILRGIIDRKGGNRVTVKAFGGIFLRNALNNLMLMGDFSPVSALAGKFKGSNALIVSSAPSADDYMEKIRLYRGGFFIIAVDSALPMLEEHGIKADFSISIDPQQRIHEHFAGHCGMGTAHVFSIVSPPSIVERYGGFISLNSHPVSQVIDEFFPGRVGSIDSATGSVAGDALNFALLAGFDNIAMTGFDFSFSRNTIYAAGTSYQKRYSLYFNSRFVTPESFNASYIFRGSGSLMQEGRYTRRSFVGYRDSLERFIEGRCKTPPVIINSRGLRVRGGEYSSIEEFAAGGNAGGAERLSPEELVKSSVKIKEIIDRRRIADFIAQRGVMSELLKHSLGGEQSGARGERFLKLLDRL